MAGLVQLVLGHRRMTAQPIPAIAAYSGSQNDLSVTGLLAGSIDQPGTPNGGSGVVRSILDGHIRWHAGESGSWLIASGQVS
jgi:hypothetical protein